MVIVLRILTIIVSAVLIVSVSMQESKSSGLGVIGGGAEQLFGKKKSRGYDMILHRITLICLVAYFILALIALFIK